MVKYIWSNVLTAKLGKGNERERNINIMKKTYITIAAAAALMLAFTGCGKVESDSSSAADSTASAAAVSAADETSAAADTASADVSGAELELPSTDVVDPGVPADPEDVQVGLPSDSSDANVAADGDTVFTTAGGEYTYHDLVYYGYANTMNGKQYCIVPTDGAAGQAYFNAYTSTDGTNWTDAGTYSEPNGDNYHYPLEDGRIILFNAGGPASVNVPGVYAISLSDSGTVSNEQVSGFFDGLTTNDGTPLTSATGLSFYVSYNGGYNFTFSFTDEAGNMVFNGNYELDPTTLKITG